jgi:dienelactone hydrolase
LQQHRTGKIKRGTLFLRRTVIFSLTILLFGMGTSDTEYVSFSSFDLDGRHLPYVLEGIVTKPDGRGRFPGVVMLHGSGGIGAGRDADWVKRLTGWGYVTLQVDSFGPRNATPAQVIKRSSRVPHDSRARDAHGALRYLSQQSYIDPKRIAVMGWSHGGLSTIVSILESYPDIGFKAAVAFYPYCNRSLDRVGAPLLILAGELDDWCPAWHCSQMMPTGESRHDVLLKIYPDAYHDFDWPGMDKVVKGHRVKFNAKATDDAALRVKAFLSSHLK